MQMRNAAAKTRSAVVSSVANRVQSNMYVTVDN